MTATTDANLDDQEHLTAQSYGQLFASRLFAGRKGHGGAPIVYMQLKQADVANIAAAAFELGEAHTRTTFNAQFALLRAIWNEQDLTRASPEMLAWAKRMAAAMGNLQAVSGTKEPSGG